MVWKCILLLVRVFEVFATRRLKGTDADCSPMIVRNASRIQVFSAKNSVF
jgi:hypothetical protein